MPSWNEDRVYYKMVEAKDGVIKTLFHGTNKTRVLETGKWLKADLKLGYDGSKARKYLTGWHVMPDMPEFNRLLKRFKNLDNRYLIECRVKDTWDKKHSPYNIKLARWLFIDDDVKLIPLKNE